jgi:RNA polymerase sigma-70 factor (ECF subfamily)
MREPEARFFMVSEPSRDQWLAKALEAFELALVRYTRRIIGDEERARDVVQDTFLKLWRLGPKGHGDNLRAWLYAVCRNGALDVLRKERRMVTTEPAELAEVAQPEGEKGEALDAPVLQALGRLPVNQREVIRLKFQEGLSYREISQVTGLTETNVGYLIHTGIKSMRSALASSAGSGSPAGRGKGGVS